MHRCLIAGIACTALAAGGLIVSGCGGSGGSTGTGKTGTPKSPSAGFVVKAEAVCKALNVHIGREVEEVVRRVQNPTGPVITKLTERVVIPTVQKELDQIRALEIPPAAKRKIEALLVREQAAVNRVKADPSLIGAFSDPLMTSALAKRYGLSICGLGAGGA